MTTRSWESVARERAEMAQMGRAQSELKRLSLVEVLLPIALLGTVALEVYRAPAGGSRDKLGSMAKPKVDLELIEPYSRWLARILWRDGKWRVLEGRYENKNGRSNARDPNSFIVWNPEVYQFSSQKTAILFAQDFLDGQGGFTNSRHIDPAFRRAHLVR